MINILFDEIFHFAFYKKIIRLEIELYKRIRYIYIQNHFIYLFIIYVNLTLISQHYHPAL